MNLFLFFLTVGVPAALGLNIHNSGKADIYEQNPRVAVDDAIDAVTDAYKNSPNITQAVYNERYNQ